MNSPGSFILVVAGRLTVEFNEVSEPVFQLITNAVKDRELVWKITFCRRRIFYVLINHWGLSPAKGFSDGHLAQQVPATSSSLELLFTPQEPDSSTVTVSSLSPQLQAAVSARLSSRTTKTSHSLPSGSRTQVLS